VPAIPQIQLGFSARTSDAKHDLTRAVYVGGQNPGTVAAIKFRQGFQLTAIMKEENQPRGEIEKCWKYNKAGISNHDLSPECVGPECKMPDELGASRTYCKNVLRRGNKRNSSLVV